MNRYLHTQNYHVIYPFFIILMSTFFLQCVGPKALSDPFNTCYPSRICKDNERCFDNTCIPRSTVIITYGEPLYALEDNTNTDISDGGTQPDDNPDVIKPGACEKNSDCPRMNGQPQVCSLLKKQCIIPECSLNAIDDCVAKGKFGMACIDYVCTGCITDKDCKFFGASTSRTLVCIKPPDSTIKLCMSECIYDEHCSPKAKLATNAQDKNKIACAQFRPDFSSLTPCTADNYSRNCTCQMKDCFYNDQCPSKFCKKRDPDNGFRSYCSSCTSNADCDTYFICNTNTGNCEWDHIP
jgi:hypothetical protein